MIAIRAPFYRSIMPSNHGWNVLGSVLGSESIAESHRLSQGALPGRPAGQIDVDLRRLTHGSKNDDSKGVLALDSGLDL